MQIDAVVGNPSYNGGLDIDFVVLGFNLSSKYLTMITPAKWQTAEANQSIKSVHSYGYFRKNIVPYMKYVCFYPDCKDVFNIMQQDGITYFLLDHSKIESCTVVNKCKNVSYFNQTSIRDITHREQLINVGNEINELLKDRPKFKFRQLDMGQRYIVCTNCQLPGGGLYAITKRSNKVYYLGVSEVYDTSEPYWNICLSQQMRVTFTQDRKNECESFASYLNSRFVRFFIALNIGKLHPVTQNDYFRFVPEPPNGLYDHIFTDDELYEYFNIPDKYVEVINGVVKSR